MKTLQASDLDALAEEGVALIRRYAKYWWVAWVRGVYNGEVYTVPVVYGQLYIDKCAYYIKAYLRINYDWGWALGISHYVHCLDGRRYYYPALDIDSKRIPKELEQMAEVVWHYVSVRNAYPAWHIVLPPVRDCRYAVSLMAKYGDDRKHWSLSRAVCEPRPKMPRFDFAILRASGEDPVVYYRFGNSPMAKLHEQLRMELWPP